MDDKKAEDIAGGIWGLLLLILCVLILAGMGGCVYQIWIG